MRRQATHRNSSANGASPYRDGESNGHPLCRPAVRDASTYCTVRLRAPNLVLRALSPFYSPPNLILKVRLRGTAWFGRVPVWNQTPRSRVARYASKSASAHRTPPSSRLEFRALSPFYSPSYSSVSHPVPSRVLYSIRQYLHHFEHLHKACLISRGSVYIFRSMPQGVSEELSLQWMNMQS